MKDPRSLTRSLFGQQKSGTLPSSKQEVEKFLWNAHSNPGRDQGVGANWNVRKLGKPSTEPIVKEHHKAKPKHYTLQGTRNALNFSGGCRTS